MFSIRAAESALRLQISDSSRRLSCLKNIVLLIGYIQPYFITITSLRPHRNDILLFYLNQLQVKSGDLSCVKNNSASNKDILTLKVCRADAVYSRDSLEAMTLTSHYFTENAYKFYDSIAGRKSGILPAVLLTQTKFKRHVTKDDGTTLDRFDVDNAAFADLDSTDLNKFGLFIIFPTSTKSFDESGLNLWEVPFVMRHEFGHHVFAHYLGSAVKSVGLKLNDSMSIDLILPGPTRQRPRHTASFSLTAVTSAQFAVNGINETYADLFAYFAGDSAKDQLKGIKCLDAVRDPSRATYVDGSKKGIDENSIDIYEGRAFAAEKKDCAKPTFDDEHDIAAALGQPLAAFIETSYPGLTGAQRAEVLLNWAKKLNPLFRGSKRDIRIDNIVKELVLAVKEKNGLKKDACDNLKPAITGLPLATAACDP